MKLNLDRTSVWKYLYFLIFVRLIYMHIKFVSPIEYQATMSTLVLKSSRKMDALYVILRVNLL